MNKKDLREADIRTKFADAPTPANLKLPFHRSWPDLRKVILTLAVQGKLVPQDTTEESAPKGLSRLGLKATADAGGGREYGSKTLRS